MNNRSDKQKGNSLYDHPLYYDILFGWDRSAEAAFYDAAFQHYGIGDGSRLLEVGCGTGQIAVRLAKRGRLVTGLDFDRKMLDFLEKAAQKAAVSVTALCADMTDFSIDPPFDGAYCPMGTLGLLATDDLLVSHLKSIGKNLRPEGIYIIDLGFAEEVAGNFDFSSEEWSLIRDGIEVASADGKVLVDDKPQGIKLVLEWGEDLRQYTSKRFTDLVAESGMFSIEAWCPEAGKLPDEISFFDINKRKDPPLSGRTMVVLKRH